MSHGNLLVLDTPMNIKKRFGFGYNLFVEPVPNFVDSFPQVKTEIDEIVKEFGEIDESNDSTPKKLIYLIPFDKITKVHELLAKFEEKFPQLYVDVEMNSLEDAYVNIAREEEKLYTDVNKQNQMLNDDMFKNYHETEGNPGFF